MESSGFGNWQVGMTESWRWGWWGVPEVFQSSGAPGLLCWAVLCCAGSLVCRAPTHTLHRNPARENQGCFRQMACCTFLQFMQEYIEAWKGSLVPFPPPMTAVLESRHVQISLGGNGGAGLGVIGPPRGCVVPTHQLTADSGAHRGPLRKGKGTGKHRGTREGYRGTREGHGEAKGGPTEGHLSRVLWWAVS